MKKSKQAIISMSCAVLCILIGAIGWVVMSFGGGCGTPKTIFTDIEKKCRNDPRYKGFRMCNSSHKYTNDGEVYSEVISDSFFPENISSYRLVNSGKHSFKRKSYVYEVYDCFDEDENLVGYKIEIKFFK